MEDKSDEKNSKSDKDAKLLKKYKRSKQEVKKLKKLIDQLEQENKELKDELDTLKGVISVYSEQKMDSKINEVEDAEEFEDDVESFDKDNSIAEAKVPMNEEDFEPRIFDKNTVLDILCGLGITSSRQFDDSVLVPDDYSYSYQFKVKRTTHQLLKFKDFAPKVFNQIRHHWNVSSADLLFSFRYDNLEAIRGAGKSGAFFIFTKDKKFILKTATKDERDFLWEILPYYLLYIRKNPNTLLPRFYGVYSMKHEGIGGVTRFVIMNNWFNTQFNPNELYDLKGSTVGRTTLEAKKGSILKDLDIKRKLYLPPNIKKEFIEQLERDSKFLASHNVMDYSLLLGISYNEDDSDVLVSKNKKDDFYSAFHESDGGTIGYNHELQRQEIYFFGIIDILQRYNGRKKLEHLFKSMAYSSYRISIVQPSYYAKRFLKFLNSLLDDGEDSPVNKKKERPKKKPLPSIQSSSSEDRKKEIKKKKKPEEEEELKGTESSESGEEL